MLRTLQLTPSLVQISFPTGEIIEAKHCFEVKNFVVAGDDRILFVYSKDFSTLARIDANFSSYEPLYSKKEDTIVFKFWFANIEKIIDLDTLEITEEGVENKNYPTSFKLTKRDDNDFVSYVFLKNENLWKIEAKGDDSKVKFFLKLENYIAFGSETFVCIAKHLGKDNKSYVLKPQYKINSLSKSMAENTLVIELKNGEKVGYNILSEMIIFGPNIFA